MKGVRWCCIGVEYYHTKSYRPKVNLPTEKMARTPHNPSCPGRYWKMNKAFWPFTPILENNMKNVKTSLPLESFRLLCVIGALCVIGCETQRTITRTRTVSNLSLCGFFFYINKINLTEEPITRWEWIQIAEKRWKKQTFYRSDDSIGTDDRLNIHICLSSRKVFWAQATPAFSVTTHTPALGIFIFANNF